MYWSESPKSILKEFRRRWDKTWNLASTCKTRWETRLRESIHGCPGPFPEPFTNFAARLCTVEWLHNIFKPTTVDHRVNTTSNNWPLYYCCLCWNILPSQLRILWNRYIYLPIIACCTAVTNWLLIMCLTKGFLTMKKSRFYHYCTNSLDSVKRCGRYNNPLNFYCSSSYYRKVLSVCYCLKMFFHYICDHLLHISQLPVSTSRCTSQEVSVKVRNHRSC